MSGSDLRRRLRNATVPEEHEARERSWRVVRAAYAERRPTTTVGSTPRRLAVALVAAGIVLAIVLTPAGAKVVDFVDDAVSPGARHAEPTLTHLPGGRVLVESTNGPWVVNADGAKRLLGDYDEAAWSAGGRFVAVTAGRELEAVEPTATDAVHWSIPSQQSVTNPSWSTSGVRVAYLSGDSLRLVAGDGTEDRPLARHVASVTPEWRPQRKPLPPDFQVSGVPRANLLAYATSSGRVVVEDTDSGKVLLRSGDTAQRRGLAWSSDGKLLLSFTAHELRTYDFASRTRFPIAAGMPQKTVLQTVAFQPGSHRVAAITTTTRSSKPRSSLLLGRPDTENFLAERPLSDPGRFSDLAWSPEGDWLLVGWSDADQWLFFNPATRHVTPVGDIAGQFDAGATSGVPFPSVAGWCCTSLGTNSP
ncbi:MAG: hypothetical protein ACJ75I_05915 [Solirubrobacterales bacterium]